MILYTAVKRDTVPEIQENTQSTDNSATLANGSPRAQTHAHSYTGSVHTVPYRAEIHKTDLMEKT